MDTEWINFYDARLVASTIKEYLIINGGQNKAIILSIKDVNSVKYKYFKSLLIFNTSSRNGEKEIL